ncbi:MAG: diacylglycerol kinase family protein [Terriglobales bacterium]
MRAAAILGPGTSAKDLKPFRQNSETSWMVGPPADPSEADAILIFGGDGTVHRYLPQLVTLRIPVLVVPCGSGNDFARALGLRGHRDSLLAWQKFCSGGGNLRTIDLGVIAPFIADTQAAGEAPAPHKHYFCCVGGVGLDAEIGRRANRLPRWLLAHGGYVLSLPSALFGFAPAAMKISSSDAGNPEGIVARNIKPMMVAAFANTPTYGGGMKVAPRARLDDGKIDVCTIGHMNKFKLLCLFPSVFFGRHLGIPEVEYFQTERLRVETEEPRDVYADGEYVCRTPIEVSVARGALRVIRA